MPPPSYNALAESEPTGELAGKVLDSLASAVAAVNKDGIVLATNWMWRQLSLDPIDTFAGLQVGDNFLTACLEPSDIDPAIGEHIADGASRVLAGKAPRFEVQFEVPGDDGGRWFLLVVTNLAGIGVALSRTETTTHHTVQEVFADLAFRDALTGLPNRWLVLDRLRMALGRSGRRGTWATVIFADLDGFKAVNDKFGHNGGDLVLATVSRRLREALRSEDTCGRWGGDEFIAVLEIEGPDILPLITQRLHRTLTNPIPLVGTEVRVGVSLGVALAQSEENVEHLVSLADEAMYRAKRSGRTVQFTALPGGGSVMTEL